MPINGLVNLHLSESDQQQPSAAQSIALRLQRALLSCPKSIEGGDFSKLEEAISELVDFLNSISDAIASESQNEDSDEIVFEVLSQIHGFVGSSSVDQVVLDALSFELPKAVARFACVSKRCPNIAEDIIEVFIETCGPRDMLPILCEALGAPSNKFGIPGYFSPLLGGLAKVTTKQQSQSKHNPEPHSRPYRTHKGQRKQWTKQTTDVETGRDLKHLDHEQQKTRLVNRWSRSGARRSQLQEI
ncbi:unnamed protein product [Ilex paraguariensis]|uniref:Aberrant root formation protein 4 n=1 Tax=Ilex paraguariensis TaxID=185542 RepID=A0ABC8RPH1_9AQUA